MFTPFGPIFHTPWKGFYTGFDFFRGYKKGTLVWNELKQFWVNNEDTRLVSTDAVQIPLFVGNKAKQQILNGGKKKTTHAKFYEKWKKKGLTQQRKWLVSIRNVTLVCVSGGKKCLFSGKFGVLFLLVTFVLRFALLTYYRRTADVFWTYSAHWSIASIADFEHLITCWTISTNKNLYWDPKT